ncbi:tyrosine-type recombinase/integrase, partial [Klebsiella quasipneumoniae]
GFAENTDDLFVGKTLLHGDVLMWLMKTLLTSGCTNQRGAGQYRGMKMKEEHIVPLSRQAMILLEQLKQISGDKELLFPGDHDAAKVMSENTVNSALRAMGYDTKTEVCGHGFRTMARGALGESGLWSDDAIERQLSHTERNNVRAAYIHTSEHLDERRLMVQWWANYFYANVEQYVSPYDFAKKSLNMGMGVI